MVIIPLMLPVACSDKRKCMRSDEEALDLKETREFQFFLFFLLVVSETGLGWIAELGFPT